MTSFPSAGFKIASPPGWYAKYGLIKYTLPFITIHPSCTELCCRISSQRNFLSGCPRRCAKSLLFCRRLVQLASPKRPVFFLASDVAATLLLEVFGKVVSFMARSSNSQQGGTGPYAERMCCTGAMSHCLKLLYISIRSIGNVLPLYTEATDW